VPGDPTTVTSGFQPHQAKSHGYSQFSTDPEHGILSFEFAKKAISRSRGSIQEFRTIALRIFEQDKQRPATLTCRRRGDDQFTLQADSVL
jgi:hypothetical protein